MAGALPYIAAGTGLLGTIGSLFGGGRGEPTEYKPTNPQASAQQNELMEYLMGKMREQQPYAQVNPMSMDAMNMASQFYTGSPYMHPGFGGQAPPMGQPGMQPGMGGMGGGGNPMGFGGNPMGGGRIQPKPFMK